MDERVLVLAPVGRDAAITCALLAQQGIHSVACADLRELTAEIAAGAGAALITEEAFSSPDTSELVRWVEAQPRWSDFPFVVLAKGGAAPRTAQAYAVLESLRNIVLLERPLQSEALIRAAKSALRGRRRQYEVREFAVTLEQAVAERTQELVGARERLEIALDAADMGGWDLDLQQDTTQRTQRHDEIFGYPEMLPAWGRERLLQHVVSADRERVVAAFEEAGRTGRLDLECRIRTGAGAERWIALKGRVYYDDQAAPVRMTGVVADISARKEADEQLAQSQKMDTIGQLTGGVAHDFNNLLTPIVGSLDLLRRRLPDDDRTRRLVGQALQAAERAATLTQRLLAFSRRQTLQPAPVDTGALIDGLVELMARSLGPTIEVLVDVPRHLARALVDPNQLELALLNLAVNARDAMPAGGRLRITAAEDVLGPQNNLHLPPGVYIKIATQDEGVGMDASTLQRAIEPFFSTKGMGKGTGLGLSMVHGLAAQSGGTLRIDSEPGRGTTVSLWLPSTEEPAALSSSSGQEIARSPIESAVILLVDDEDLVRRATADMLTDLGYKVVQAASASRALELLQSGLEFDVIVSDYLMPGISGAGLAAELRSTGIRTPLLIITGYANAAEDLPPDVPRLSKPFRQVELAARVASLIRPIRDIGQGPPALRIVE